jgi:hypothetical protein
MRRFRGNTFGVSICIVAAALIVAAVMALRQPTTAHVAGASDAQPDLSAQWHIGPTLRELRANFAVLRRPATAGEHAAVAMFTGATSRKPEVPEEVRSLGRVEGHPVYLVVYPVFRHGAWGRVVAHELTVAGGNGGGLGGMAYIPGNYLIFPATDATPTSPTAYVGLVPDGVRRVRWQFACLSGTHVSTSGCQLPSPRVADLPVHDNLAVLQTAYTTNWTGGSHAFAGVTKVTWYGADGLTKTFTNQNAAVPFPGAPARTG